MLKTRGISQEEVFAAACKLAAAGLMPTTASLRHNLGRGSETTLHKYLQEWKAILLKHAARIGQDNNLALLDENQLLRQNLNALTQNLEQISVEMHKIEVDNANFAKENLQLKQEILQQTNTLVEYQSRIDSLQESIVRNSQDNQKTIEQLLADKRQAIESLQEEMREIQVDAVEKMREYSFKDRDLLIAEQVKNLNLQSEIERLQAPLGGTKSNIIPEVQIDSMKAIARNSKAQLLAEVYALKSQGILKVEDENDATNS